MKKSDGAGQVRRKRPYRMRSRRRAVDEGRERVLRTAYDLWREQPYDEVSLDMIARAAGVSRQTLHRQFGSKDKLAVAVTDWIGPQFDEVMQGGEPGDVAGGLRNQIDFYESMGDANVRFLQMEGRISAVDYALRRGRMAHRAWVKHVFQPYLPAHRQARDRAVFALYAATDVMVWKLLRRDFGLSRRATEAVIDRLVRGVLHTIADEQKDVQQ